MRGGIGLLSRRFLANQEESDQPCSSAPLFTLLFTVTITQILGEREVENVRGISLPPHEEDRVATERYKHPNHTITTPSLITAIQQRELGILAMLKFAQ